MMSTKGVVNSKSKRMGVRVPLRDVELIRKLTDNDSDFIREAIREKLQREGHKLQA